MINTGWAFSPCGKGKVAEEKGFPRNLLSGRKRNTFTTVAEIFFRVELLNNLFAFYFYRGYLLAAIFILQIIYLYGE